VSGAISPDAAKTMLEAAGFRNVEITPKPGSEEIIRSWNLGFGVEKAAVAADIVAVRPAETAEANG
jgi:hypothetical protein